MHTTSRQKVNYQPYIHIVLLLLLCTTVVATVILACTPPISRDALIHHLQIPKLYLQHGGIYEIPDLIFSYYPMNLDLLYMGALGMDNDILPKYIHMAFGLATAFLLYRYLKKRLPTKYAYLGVLFFLSIPIIIKLSITVYVDLGLVFFSTASMLLLFRWIEKEYHLRYLVLAGLCCGLAIGTKYNGLLVLFLLSLFIPVLYIRTSKEQRNVKSATLKAALIFIICALVIAAPWFVRNIIWTGNPVYPLYDGFFNPPTTTGADTITDGNNVRGVFATRYVLYGENIWQLLLLPVRIFFEGMDDDPRYFDGRLNPFLLLLPLVAFLVGSTRDKRIHIEKITLLCFCLLYFLFAFNTGVLRIRYLSPMIPFLVLLAMYGLHNIESLTKQYVTNRSILVGAWLLPASIMLTLNGMYICLQFQETSPLSYLSGRLSRDEYLVKYRPEYKVMQYANIHLPDSAKILCIFMGWRGYYLENDHVFDQDSNSKWLLAWLKEDKITTKEIIKRLREKEISHLLIRMDLINHWLKQDKPEIQFIWNKLQQKNLTLLASHLHYSLFRLAYDN